jgi:hypothetical protein
MYTLSHHDATLRPDSCAHSLSWSFDKISKANNVILSTYSLDIFHSMMKVVCRAFVPCATMQFLASNN